MNDAIITQPLGTNWLLVKKHEQLKSETKILEGD